MNATVQPLWMLVGWPMAGALAAWLVGRARPESARWISLATALVQAFLTAFLVVPVLSAGGMRVWQVLAASAARVPLAVEGLSGTLVALTTSRSKSGASPT